MDTRSTFLVYLLSALLFGFAIFNLYNQTNSKDLIEISPPSVIRSFVVSCSGYGQVCDENFDLNITTKNILRIKFDANETHCSPIRVSFYVDGQKRFTSSWLGWNEGSTPNKISTNLIEIRPVSAGQHIISVGAEGYPAGCNTGSLGSWGGTVSVETL